MIKKLNRLDVEKKLKQLDLSVFTPKEFRVVFEVAKNTASVFLSKNVTSGLFIKLRNGFYSIKDSQPSLYSIANKLYNPSYVSLESALSYYGVIPESVYGLSSITSKATREFETPLGIFSYQSIKQAAFKGYSLKRIDRENVFIADEEKALADYLYFVDLKRISLNDRLSLGKISKKKLIEYTKIFNRPSTLSLIDQIYAKHRQPTGLHSCSFASRSAGQRKNRGFAHPKKAAGFL